MLPCACLGVVGGSEGGLLVVVWFESLLLPPLLSLHAAADLPVGPSSCSMGQGLSYKPRAGDAVLFYSQHPDLTLDPRSVHAGCPVGRGSEKWVITKWLRNKPLVATGGFGWGD